MTAMTEAEALKALIDWQAELGADLPIGEVPVNRYAAPAPARGSKAAGSEPAQTPPASVAAATADPVSVAEAAARATADLASLSAAMAAFDLCDLRRGARNLVFADGDPRARVMIVGEAPGRDEDIAGKPFVGRAGQLLDRMLAAIDLHRGAGDPRHAVYITNMLPWRPPQNRNPTTEELNVFRPFAMRHIELAAPEIVVAMGNSACQGLFGRSGISKLRGAWTQAAGRPCLPMFHPAYLLRNPAAKSDAWTDLLALAERLA